MSRTAEFPRHPLLVPMQRVNIYQDTIGTIEQLVQNFTTKWVQGSRHTAATQDIPELVVENLE